MKAIVYEKYGGPENLRLKEIKTPLTKPNEVLVKVQAVSLNPLDWHLMRGTPLPLRFQTGLFKPKNNIPGADIAGVVEETGEGVQNLKPGDKVYGDLAAVGCGGLAEFVTAPAQLLAPIPDGITWDEAAAMPVAGVTALQGLRDKGGLKEGMSVLINCASGGVGTFAVQIAKALGAEVTGVCSTRNLEMVQMLGADHLVDYTRDDFSKLDRKHDLILDIVGNLSFGDLKRSLKNEGRAVIVGFKNTGLAMQIAMMGAITSGKKIGMMLAKGNREDLLFLNGLVESGKLKSVIDWKYPMSEASNAMEYLEKGHAHGKVIVRID